MGMNRNAWVENVFRPLVIAMMLGCIALSVADLLYMSFPIWNRAYLTAGCVLAALEACYSRWLVRKKPLRGDDALRVRVFEIASLFILIKLASYMDDSWADVVADVRTWPYQPLHIFDIETMVAFVLAFISWAIATRTIHDLERIGEPPPVRAESYTPPRERLANRFFWGGGILLVTAGITRVGIANLLNLERPPVPQLVLNALLYFLLGLAMLGQVHFTRLHQQWEAQKIKVADQLASRWVHYSLAFVGLAALLAFLLPTGYTVGLLDAVAVILNVLAYVLAVLTTIIWLLLSLLLLPFTWLFNMKPPNRPRSLPLFRSYRSPQPSLSTAGGLDWIELLKSLLFWTITLGMVYYVIRSYLRDHPEILEALSSLKPIRILRDFLTALWRRFTGWAQFARDRMPRRLLGRWMREDGSSKGPFRFFRLGALPPRERVLYYYLSVLRRAGQRGLPRRRAQTPHEYEGALNPHLPEAQQDLTQLTEAFIEARYSLHAFDRKHDQQARAHWRRVRAALQSLKRRARAKKQSDTHTSDDEPGSPFTPSLPTNLSIRQQGE
jgi:hypothetical protein